MKKSHLIIYSLIFITLFLISNSLSAQRNFDDHKEGFIWRHWYAKANVSINALFGDVSTYDYDPFKKMSQESGLSGGASFGKWVTTWGAAEFNFSLGNLYAFKNNLEVNTNFYQYTIQGVINFNQLFDYYYAQTPFYVYGKIGYGLIDFNAILTDMNTGDTIRMQGVLTPHDKRVSEWVIPLGVGGTYNFTDNLSMFIDFNYFYVDTDKLDGKFISSDTDFNDNKDHYTTLSIGLMYTFNVRNTLGKYNSRRSPLFRNR